MENDDLYQLMLDVDLDVSDDEDFDYIPEREDYYENEDEEGDEFLAEEISSAPSSSAQYVGKNGYIWNRKPKQRRGRAAPPKKQIFVPGSRAEAISVVDPLEIWKLFFDESILREILDCTNKEMNLRATDRTGKNIIHQSYHGALSYNELLAVFGLLYLAGVQKSAKLNLDELWSLQFGITIFRTTMSQHRFKYILVCLRFDDRETRTVRAAEDNFALIRNIWDKFIANCMRLYSPSANLTIDEQLLSFRGNCRFKMYIPSKPAKYGMKIVMLNDTATGYMFNAIPYVGLTKEEREKKKRKLEEMKASQPSTSRTVDNPPVPKKQKAEKGGPPTIGKSSAPRKKLDLLGEQELGKQTAPKRPTGKTEKQKSEKLKKPDPPSAPKETKKGQKNPKQTAEYFVRELTRSIHNTNRSVTCDNWFSSIPMFEKMWNDFKTFMTGTLRRNKPEIPPQFLAKKAQNSTIFGFDDNKVLVSFAAKSNRNVLLLSTLGELYNERVDPKTSKPDVILFYNSTKSGTDTFDQLCSLYTVARKTNRWPLRILYGMLDQAGVNSMILYYLNFKKNRASLSQQEGKILIRRLFLRNLGLSLVKPLLEERGENTNVRTYIRNAIREMLNADKPSRRTSSQPPSRTQTTASESRRSSSQGRILSPVHCEICKIMNRKRLGTGRCDFCGRTICNEHRSWVCTECVKSSSRK